MRMLDGQRKKVRIMLKLLRPFKLCVIDEFAADLDIFSRARFFEYLSKSRELRGAAAVYATHIFDQADKWATHVAFMQLDKKLSPVHRLHDYAPYQEILAATGKDRAYCPMYVLVLEELERQYRSHSHLFDADNQCLTDVIMAEQASEKAADRRARVRQGLRERPRRARHGRRVHGRAPAQTARGGEGAKFSAAADHAYVLIPLSRDAPRRPRAARASSCTTPASASSS